MIDDKVQGKVTFANKDLDDLVLLRSDGNPTYMLAVVVDDHDMGVTHVIRGDDHLTNAARQTQIYQALGWDVPVMGAYPADPRPRRREALQAPRRARRRRLSRHGLPAGGAAQLSGAARLELRRQGVLHRRGADRRLRSAGDRPLGLALRFRQAREHERPFHARRRATTSCSKRWSTRCPICRAARRCLAKLDDGKRAQIARAIPGLKERAKTLVELLDGAEFLFAERPLAMDAKAADILAKGGRAHLKALLPRLGRRRMDAPGARGGRARLRRGDRRQARRGRPAAARRGSPAARPRPAFSTCSTVLGREESLGRIADQAG